MGRKMGQYRSQEKRLKMELTLKYMQSLVQKSMQQLKKGDPDPESNSALKFVIDRAKQAQVPKHVIDKAIDKAKGNTDENLYRRTLRRLWTKWFYVDR